MRRLSFFLPVALLASSLALATPTPASGAAKAPLTCRKVTRDGKAFRLCTGLVTAKDKSVKLDTDVTLPKRGKGPFPLIVMLHGLGGGKDSYESTTIEGSGGAYHANNLWFASRGYAVMNYTARGFHADECLDPSIQAADADAQLYPDGSSACRPQLDHVDHEIKDTQYLVGRLVDGTLTSLGDDVGIAAKKVGVFGVSYGGGHTWLLTRRNSWRSPRGARIRLAAATPIIAWTDLLDALVPNGRARDDVVPAPDITTRAAEAFGVAKRSYIRGFYLTLQLTSAQQLQVPGYLEAWYDRLVNGGEPYDGPIVADAAESLLANRSAYYVPKKGSFDTPILSVQGFTDQVFPAIESLRMVARLKQENAAYPISTYLGDFGHPISQNKADEVVYIAGLINGWFDHYLKGKGEVPIDGIEARTTVCGPDAIGDLYRGPDWTSVREGAQIFDLSLDGDLDTGVNDPHAQLLDPVPDTGDRGVCRVMDTAVATGNLAEEVVLADDMTMLGLPEVSFTATPSVDDLYVAVRLFDVDPGSGQQTLVTRGVYRLQGTQAQDVSFQLFGNGWDFPAGHSLKLELTATDSPTFRKSNATGTIAVSEVGLVVPLANPAALVP